MNAAQIAATLPFQPYWLPNLALWLDPSRQIYTDSAGSFASASSQYLSVANNASLTMGDIDMWVCATFTYASTGSSVRVVNKWGAGNTLEFSLFVSNTNIPVFVVSPDGTTGGSAVSAAGSALTPGTTYRLFGWHDKTANVVGLIVNGGTPSTTSYSNDIFAGTAALQIGGRGGVGDYLNGRAESVMFGRDVPGGFATTPAATIDALIGGVKPSSLTPAQITTIGGVSAWLDNAQSSLIADAWGSNTLTNNAVVTVGSGSILTAAYPGSVEGTQRDLVTNLAFAQTTYANRSLLGVASTGAMYSLFDGTNDSLVGSDAGFPSGAAPRSVFLVACPAVLTGSAFGYGTYVATQMNEIFISASTWRWSQNGTTVNIAAAVANRTDVVGFTFDGSLTRTYLNGSPGGTSSATVATVLGQAVIGNEPSPSAGYRFNGRIGQIVVFNRVLSTAEIQRLTAFLGQKALI